MKLWGGRFTGKVNDLVDTFNSSISFDSRMYKEDIEGSIAHATMLGEEKIIPKEDSKKIVSGLLRILEDLNNSTLNINESSEDIHSFIESTLIDYIGEEGKKLHTGRSRNDQVTLDTKLYLKNSIKALIGELLNLEETIVSLASKNKDTIMPGYTHMQKAQPITFAHHILAYGEMFKRDTSRLLDCYKRLDEMPLGSGALATTTYPINRERVAELLGFSKITLNSLDSVSDRDYSIETLSCLSFIMMHLSRFSEEIILWSTDEFKFIELDDSYSTGSSIMPQKKNPDVAELVRGKTGRVYGDLLTLLTVMKSLPLAYNKDMQEDKESLFDGLDTTMLSLKTFNGMIKTMKIKKDIMKNSCTSGFTNATDVADYLVKKGVAFRDAHKIVGNLVLHCLDENISIENLSLSELKSFSSKFDEDIYNAIDIFTCIEERKVIGGPSTYSINIQLECLKNFIEKNKHNLQALQ